MRRPLPLIALFTAALAAGCPDSSTPPDGTRGSAGEARATREGDGARPLGSAPPSSRLAVTPSQLAATLAEDLAPRGRQVYLSSCIACHNADPAKDGALGPAVSDASLELLEARVLRGAYPDGYVPKRNTAVMVAMPFLEKQIPAIAAYLAASDR